MNLAGQSLKLSGRGISNEDRADGIAPVSRAASMTSASAGLYPVGSTSLT